jgi:hypothetical protein
MTRLFILAFSLLAIGLLKADDTTALPIKSTFRESLMVKGTFVQQFRNEGDKGLLLHIEITRADNSEKKTFTLLVPANGVKEIGKLQGWIGKSGDGIRIQSEGFPELDVHIP